MPIQRGKTTQASNDGSFKPNRSAEAGQLDLAPTQVLSQQQQAKLDLEVAANRECYPGLDQAKAMACDPWLEDQSIHGHAVTGTRFAGDWSDGSDGTSTRPVEVNLEGGRIAHLNAHAEAHGAVYFTPDGDYPMDRAAAGRANASVFCEGLHTASSLDHTSVDDVHDHLRSAGGNDATLAAFAVHKGNYAAASHDADLPNAADRALAFANARSRVLELCQDKQATKHLIDGNGLGLAHRSRDGEAFLRTAARQVQGGSTPERRAWQATVNDAREQYETLRDRAEREPGLADEVEAAHDYLMSVWDNQPPAA